MTMDYRLPQPAPMPQPMPIPEYDEDMEKPVRSDIASDGVSDLLYGPDIEEEEEDLDDLVTVDYEEDILDAGDDGSLDDLVNVSAEDIMGTPPPPKKRQVRVYRPRPPMTPPPTSMGGLYG